MPRDISRETRINLALWRKAFREGGLEVKLSSYSQALSFRLALYRAIKPYRDDEFKDPELYEALTKYAITINKGDTILRIKDRASLLAAENVMEQLGLTELDLLSPEEQQVSARMLDELRNLAIDDEPIDKPAPAPNEFFSRE